MFEWNVENMDLMNQSNIFIGKEKIYNVEHDTTKEDKIAFVDKMQDGKLSYILFLAEKFEKDKENMPANSWGNVKKVSFKVWIKRNDDRNLIDNMYQYGYIRFMGERNIQYINKKGANDTYEDYVDEMFHRQLKECEELEHKYFLEHDEYSILKQRFRDKKYNTTFGVNVGSSSDGSIFIYEDEGNFNKRRDITIEELKYLLGKYEELDKLVSKITKKTNIKY